MKKYLSLLTIVLSLRDLSAQVSVHFPCPGSQVIAYKQGTSCSATPYQFYTIDLSGVQAATPFYTLADVNKEVNGISINGQDGYLYGIEYDRSSACVFSNFHLIRYDAAGHKMDLGLLPAPAGGSLSAALGAITANGNFLYSATDASGTRILAQITNVAALGASSGTLSATFTSLRIVGISSSYADWAVSPTDGKLYTYGIYSSGSYTVGTVVEINPVTGTITCIGSQNVTEFLDIARDNFGGVYFQPDGYLYGVNVNTRKLYKINVSTGAITYKSTMTGTGQIRADMGSCTSGLVVLPLKFKSVTLKQQTQTTVINWEMNDDVEAVNYTVEAKDRNDFRPIGNVQQHAQSAIYSFAVTPAAGAVEYRIKAELKAGGYLYSNIIHTEEKVSAYRLIANPVTGKKLDLVTPAGGTDHYTIFSINGAEEQKGMIGAGGGIASIATPNLNPGMHFIYFASKNETLRFIVN